MPRIKLDSTEWVAVQGGDLTIDVLMRRISSFEQLEIRELLEASRQQLTTIKTVDERGRLVERTETMVTAEAGRLLRGSRRLAEMVIRDWRNVESEEGIPLAFSFDVLERLTASNQAWGEMLCKKLTEFAGLSGSDTPAADPRKATASVPGS